MKVMCIDTSLRGNTEPVRIAALRQLKMMGKYEVEFIKCESYKLVGIENPFGFIVSTPYPTFKTDRFIPLSDIDELELVNEKELVS